MEVGIKIGTPMEIEILLEMISLHRKEIRKK